MEEKLEIKVPTEGDAKVILHDALGKNAKTVKRFTTGQANYVYDVETDEGEKLVVRLARPDLKYFFDGAVYWYDQLKDKDIPLPKLYFSELDLSKYGLPVMIMDRLPGEDLGLVYPKLVADQKRAIAKDIVGIQNRVASLPEGKGFGYARSYEDPMLLPTWNEFLNTSLEKSRLHIKNIGLIDEVIVDKVKDSIDQHSYYFSSVKPTCFLDDTTTKNVIIDDGKLTGIVDVDGVAFGDPLLTVGLTRMSLLSSGYQTDYIDYWIDFLDLNKEQRRAIDFYTALYCVDFMSELGRAFNKEEVAKVDDEKVEKLHQILKDLI